MKKYTPPWVLSKLLHYFFVHLGSQQHSVVAHTCVQNCMVIRMPVCMLAHSRGNVGTSLFPTVYKLVITTLEIVHKVTGVKFTDIPRKIFFLDF